MSREIARLGQKRTERARAARGPGPGWTWVGVLLLACACGSSDASPSTAPSDPPSEAPLATAPASPPDSASPAPDAGTAEPASDEVFPSGPISLPDDSEPADDPSASSDTQEELDLELACSSGQTQVICLDTTRAVLCVSGAPIQSSCDRLCDTYGRGTGPCVDGCQCGEPSNPTCVQASDDYCACTALVSDPCTPETKDRLYLACHVNGIGGALMACTADFRATRPDAPIDAAFCADLDDACD